MKKLLILSLIITFAIGSITDIAYKEYRAKHYRKAFELYKKAHNQGIKKATYNLAAFYDKGIGVKKDKQKAIELYKKFVNRAITEIYRGEVCVDSLKKYYILALKRLIYYKVDDYKSTLNILNKNCNKSNKFIKKCPYAKVIPKKYRLNLNMFDCILYKKYPKNMKKIFFYQALIKKAQDRAQMYDKYQKKLLIYAKPILKYYLYKEISCVKKAKTNGDITKCYAKYISKRDELLLESNYGNFADSRHLFSTKEEKRKREIYEKQIATKERKNEVIESIRKEIKDL